MSRIDQLRRKARKLRPRRLRLYGIGLGRTGTTSLATTFSAYRTAHEAGDATFLPFATHVMSGSLPADAPVVRDELRRRSEVYALDVDVAQFLTPVAGTLAEMYPDARFVLLVRDCFSWLNSRLEKLSLNIPSLVTPWQPWFDAVFEEGDDQFTTEEAPLRDAGLRPVAHYLRAWTEVTEGALRTVPAERLLVVRTEDLSGSIERLATFAGVPASKLTPTHTNQARYRTGVLADIPSAFVAARARELCSPLMERYWGSEWIDLADRLPTSS